MECTITKIKKTKSGVVEESVNFQTLLEAYKNLGERTRKGYESSIVYDFNSAEEIIKTRKKDLVELVNNSGKYFAKNTFVLKCWQWIKMANDMILQSKQKIFYSVCFSIYLFF